jgi:hypothetical protein
LDPVLVKTRSERPVWITKKQFAVKVCCYCVFGQFEKCRQIKFKECNWIFSVCAFLKHRNKTWSISMWMTLVSFSGSPIIILWFICLLICDNIAYGSSFYWNITKSTRDTSLIYVWSQFSYQFTSVSVCCIATICIDLTENGFVFHEIPTSIYKSINTR